MNSTERSEMPAMDVCQDLPPLSVPYAADIITLDETLFSCPLRILPLSLFDVSVYLAEITPAVAAIMLQRKNVNRSIHLAQLRRLKRAMTQGRWQLNGETIIFDHEGRLLEGQHRLQAVVDLGQPIWAFVVHGIDRERFKTMGQGAKRSAGDILGIGGVKNGSHVAAALRWVYRYTNGMLLNPHPDITDDELTDTLPQHEALIQSLPFGKRCQGIVAPGLATALHYLCRQGPPLPEHAPRGPRPARSLWDKGDTAFRKGRADDFFWRFAMGEDLHAGHPILLLRKRFLQKHGNVRLVLRDEVKAVMVILTWNFWVLNPEKSLANARKISWYPATGQPVPQIL